MFDLTSPKITTPAYLFALLSPGMLLQLPDKMPGVNANALASNKTSGSSVLFHALVFMIAYKCIARMMGLSLKKADLVVPTVLFILLSPGVLLQIPDTMNLRSGQTSLQAVLVHTLVFALVFAFLRVQFPKFY